MIRTKLIGAVLWAAGAAAAGLSGCGPVVPVSPTWKDDIRPMMIARCIRCHDNPGRVDPVSMKQKGTIAIIPPPVLGYNFNYVNFTDIPADNLAILVRAPAAVTKPNTPLNFMPPPPAEKLEDWEIETLSNWAYSPR
ncbi:MAG: hypothetical protein ABUL67_01185 [Haliangium ochraceum]